MSQIFPKSMNALPLYAAVGLSVLFAVTVSGAWYYFSPRYTDVGYRPVQPVAYSHRLHSGELGVDCRYCHASVEVSPVANVPPTQVCMNCHRTVTRDSELMAPIRKSLDSGKPMRWVRVHDLPDYAYFNHGIHVNAGVGCTSCHGAIHEMEVVQQAEPLSMAWCLDCHRNPDPHLRSPDQATDIYWTPPKDQLARAARLRERRGIAPSADCSGCHR